MKKLRMRPNNSRGYLFTFCGLDGCGKTTVISMLKKYLEEEYDIFLTKEPTPAVRRSKIFRTYMDDLDHEAYDYRSLSLFAASDRLRHGAEFVEPTLKSGNDVQIWQVGSQKNYQPGIEVDQDICYVDYYESKIKARGLNNWHKQEESRPDDTDEELSLALSSIANAVNTIRKILERRKK